IDPSSRIGCNERAEMANGRPFANEGVSCKRTESQRHDRQWFAPVPELGAGFRWNWPGALNRWRPFGMRERAPLVALRLESIEHHLALRFEQAAGRAAQAIDRFANLLNRRDAV